MAITLDQIEEQALALPLEQRAQLVDKLWESLDHTTCPVLSDEWKAEIDRRRRELLEGTVRAVPGDAVSRNAWELKVQLPAEEVEFLKSYAQEHRTTAVEVFPSTFILEKAVGTTDFTDDTDEEDVVLERAFTRRVSTEEAPALRESGYHPCHPCHPWFLNCRI